MTDQPSTHHLDVPGAQLYYEVRGTGPLVLVVGQPMTSAPFAPLADRLAVDHTVVTYDPRGLGSSSVTDPTVPVTPELEAADLAAIIDAVGGGPADVFGTSGGAVAGLALVTHHPDLVRTLIAHEPPVTELLPDAAYIRAAVEEVEDAYRAGGGGAGWGKFVSLVMHSGPVTAEGITPATWPPPGAGSQDGGAPAEEPRPAGPDDAEPTDPDHAHPAPSAKQQADDELFFLRMLGPFTRYEPEIAALRTAGPRIVVAVGGASGQEIAARSTLALAEQLGTSALPLPGDHAGFMGDPDGFDAQIRAVLAEA